MWWEWPLVVVARRLAVCWCWMDWWGTFLHFTDPSSSSSTILFSLFPSLIFPPSPSYPLSLLPISQGTGGRRGRWRYAERGCKTQGSEGDTQLQSVYICSTCHLQSPLLHSHTHTHVSSSISPSPAFSSLCHMHIYPTPPLLFLSHLPNACMFVNFLT